MAIWIIFAAGLTVTYLITNYYNKKVESELYYEFDNSCTDIKNRISARITSQALFLRTASAFIESSDHVTREEFKRFFFESNVEKYLIGIQALAYSPLIRSEEIREFEQSVTKSMNKDFRVYPESNRNEYAPVYYIEPSSGKFQNAFGYDLLSDTLNRKAMLNTIENDSISLSDRTIFASDTLPRNKSTMIMFAPVYNLPVDSLNSAEERKQELKGWISSPYDTYKLLDEIMGEKDIKGITQIGIHIYDGETLNDDNIIYEFHKGYRSGNHEEVMFSKKVKYNFIGKQWTILFEQYEGEMKLITFANTIVITIAGILLNVLILLLSLSAISSRKARRSAEELARQSMESKEWFESIFENASDSLVITNPETGRIISCNTKFSEITGYNTEEIMRMTLKDFEAPKSPESSEKDTAESFAKQAEKRNEIILFNKSGNKMFVDISSSTVKRSKETFTLSVIKDVTEKRLMNDEIQKKNKELQDMNSEKDMLFSVLGHDLRSPFAGLIGITELMADDIDSFTKEELREISRNMKSSTKKLYEMVENLLEWAMLKRNMKEFVPQKINLKELVEKCIGNDKDALSKKEITAEITIPETLSANADRNMTESIIRNLITNAVKFSRRKNKIEISAKESEEKVIVSVTDHGIGIPEKMKDKIFSINRTNNRNGTENEPSSGLGLVLCKEFTEKNGGEIWVESEEGRGSRFSFTLKLFR